MILLEKTVSDFDCYFEHPTVQVELFHPAFSCVITLCYNGRFVLSYFRPALLVLADTNRHMLKNAVLILSIRNFV